MPKEIVFKIDMETGETSMEAVGFNGMGCKKATAPFEDALGVVKDRTMKTCAWSPTTVDEAKHIKMNQGGAS